MQEKNITLPTDAKLHRKLINKFIAIAKGEGLTLSRTYAIERKARIINM